MSQRNHHLPVTDLAWTGYDAAEVDTLLEAMQERLARSANFPPAVHAAGGVAYVRARLLAIVSIFDERLTDEIHGKPPGVPQDTSNGQADRKPTPSPIDRQGRRGRDA